MYAPGYQDVWSEKYKYPELGFFYSAGLLQKYLIIFKFIKMNFFYGYVYSMTTRLQTLWTTVGYV